MIRNLLLFVSSIALIASANAQTLDIPAGKYVMKGDMGWLTIKKNKKNELRFDLTCMGANGHFCQLSGTIVNGVGHTDKEANSPECRVSFQADKSTINVDAITQEECRNYCGERAGFEGAYDTPPAVCTRENRQAQRDRALAQYQSQGYAGAAQTLEKLIAQCNDFLGWIEIDKVKSDLALAQYHNHQPAQCLETLGDTLAGDYEDADALKEGKDGFYLPPLDFDNYIGVAQTIWFNKALCEKAKQSQK